MDDERTHRFFAIHFEFHLEIFDATMGHLHRTPSTGQETASSTHSTTILLPAVRL
jgi:hypothetical protein